MSENITVKLIIYIVEAKKHHDNWNSDIEIVINEIKISNMFFVSNTEEFTNLFNRLMSFVLDTE